MYSGLQAGDSPDTLVAELAEDEQIAGSLYQASLHGHMAGQLFVRAVEVPETLPTRELDANTRPSFLRMSFREALDAFLSKRIVTPEAFQALSDQLRLRAFTATRLASQQLVERAYAELQRTLSEGGTLQDFLAAFESGDVNLGIPGAPPDSNPRSWYLETVYRTNVQQSYGQGRLAQLEHPAVVAARPLVQYRTSQDSRVRPAHQALDGVVFDRTNDPGWRRFAPPLGFNCRCAMVTVREGQATDSATLSEYGPDEGWTGPGS